MSAQMKQDDRIVGAWQQPVNRWQGAENSIHTDSVAKKIGMRGGTIPGTVHLTHFQPILRELFGERWLRDGSISMFYTYATIDREDVRAIVKRPPEGATDIQLDAWVETKEGRVVCKGTVSVGRPAEKPYLRALPLESAAPGVPRILRQMTVGMEVPVRENLIVAEGLSDGVVRDPQMMFRTLQVFPADVDTKPAVGFFGGTEIILHNGPIRGETPYRRTGKVVCVGESPKTEFAWFDSHLHDKAGQLIAEMRHMTRWMKVSSPLWSA
jgi:hypothetical protein